MKNIKTIFLPFAFLTTILFSLLYLGSCDDGPTEPEIEPGRRDYVWKVDTLMIPFTSLLRISGSSSSNVWAIGPGGDLDKTIYHFDGEKWSNDGISRGISPLSVWTYDQNRALIAGLDGKIWSYNNKIWSQDTTFEKEASMQIGFQDIWGDNIDNILTVGYSGFKTERNAVIAHFSNNRWKLYEFTNINYNFIRVRGNSENTKYYLLGIGTQNGTNVGIFEFNIIGTINLIQKGFDNQNSWLGVQEINNHITFLIGNKLYDFTNNQYHLIIEIENQNFGGQIFGRNKKDIFLRMFNGIAHYNGSDIEYLINFEENISIRDAVLFNEEIFFLASNYNSGDNLIYRGKLK